MPDLMNIDALMAKFGGQPTNSQPQPEPTPEPEPEPAPVEIPDGLSVDDIIEVFKEAGLGETSLLPNTGKWTSSRIWAPKEIKTWPEIPTSYDQYVEKYYSYQNDHNLEAWQAKALYEIDTNYWETGNEAEHLDIALSNILNVYNNGENRGFCAMLLGDLYFMPIYHNIDLDRALDFYVEAADIFDTDPKGEHYSSALYCYTQAAQIARVLRKGDVLERIAAKMKDEYKDNAGYMELARYYEKIDEDDKAGKLIEEGYENADYDTIALLLRRCMSFKNGPDDVFDYEDDIREFLDGVFNYENTLVYQLKDAKIEDTADWNIEKFDMMAFYCYYRYTLQPFPEQEDRFIQFLERGAERGSLWSSYMMGLIALDVMRAQIKSGMRDDDDTRDMAQTADRYIRQALDNGVFVALTDYVPLLRETGANDSLVNTYAQMAKIFGYNL